METCSKEEAMEAMEAPKASMTSTKLWDKSIGKITGLASSRRTSTKRKILWGIDPVLKSEISARRMRLLCGLWRIRKYRSQSLSLRRWTCQGGFSRNFKTLGLKNQHLFNPKAGQLH